ncbi:hypothetical protein ASE49_10880 [Novosphingobium sp. Leaf2]|nr:hypothetical protein ASE49_10880 [Novosphingobium sp. Leaf2]
MLCSASSLTIAASAFAQSAQQAAPSEDAPSSQSGVEDIVVTAQRREQSLQSVPVAVTAVSAESLVKSGVSDIGTLGSVSPGLVMNTNRASVTPYLRGVGTQSGDPGGSSSVAIYVDGVYYQAPAAGFFALNNIARVEVIKGPQGTLFGRNATGGLIHVITRDPSFTPSGEVSAGYGNYQTGTGSLYVTSGLSSNLAADFSAFGTYQGKGFGKNLTLGGDANYRREFAVRNKWLWTPGDDTRIVLAADYSQNSNDSGHIRAILPGSLGVGATPARGTLWDTQANLPSKADASQWGASLRIEQKFGDIKFTSTSAYRNVKSVANFDQDATPIPRVDAVFGEKTDTFQQEFTLGGGNDWLDFTAGIFFFTSNAKTTPITIRSDAIATLRVDRYATQGTDSYAAFAQATASVTPTTRITAGLRYSIDNVSIVGRDIAAMGNSRGPQGSVVAQAKQNVTFKKPTWRLAIDQDLADRVMLYASYSRGYKAGQYNVNSFSNPPVKPESLDAFEVGLKAETADRQLRVNGAAFLYKYSEIQLFRSAPGNPILVNAAAATIKGGDLELTWVPAFADDKFELRTAASYLDGEYSDYPNAAFFSPNPAGGLIQTDGDATGNTTIRSPKYTFSTTANYNVPLSAGHIDLSATFFHSAKFFFDPDNRTVQPAYSTLAGQISYTSDNGWYARIWGRNLTNTINYTAWSESTLGNLVVAAPPRTYGFTLGFKW